MSGTRPCAADSTEPELPVTVAVVNDYDLVVEGLGALLARYPERLAVCDRITIGEPIHHGPIDVALYDTFGRVGSADDALRRLIADPAVCRVGLFSMDLRPDVVAEARAAGATGFVSKGLSGDAIADAVVDIALGRHVEAFSASTRIADPLIDWPGKAAGLTERESQVLVLCAEGYTNPDIAKELHIGVETVKTHLRSVFRRLEVRNRIQAATYVQRSESFARSGGAGR